MSVTQISAADTETGGTSAAGSSPLLTMIDAAMEPLPDPCLVVDAQCRILTANHAARHILQKRGRLLGRKLDALLEDQSLSAIVGSSFKSGQNVTSEVTLHLPDEGWRNGRRFKAVLTHLDNAGKPVIHIALLPDGPRPPPPPPPEGVLVRVRNPLAVLQGYIETLLDGVITDAAMLRQSLMAMRRQTEQIERLLLSGKE